MHSSLRTSACALAVVALVGLPAAAHAERAYIGTYTPEADGKPADNHGEGIYLVDIDPATGALSHPQLVAKSLSPSWMAFSPDRKSLYAGNEISDYGPDKTGSVTAYAVDAATGALKALNTVSSGGPGPAYISVTRQISSWWPIMAAAITPSSASNRMAAWAKPPMW